MILIGGYLKASFFPHVNVVGTAIVLTVLLYIVNYFGIKPGVWSSAVMAICSLAPLTVIALSPIFRHSLFHAMYVFPFVPLHGSWHSSHSWLLVIKWMFVAAWSAYAFESASTVIAELKDPHRDAPKALVAASALGLFSFGLVPFMLLAIVGVGVITQDPSVAFLPAAQAIFGHTGALVVSIMLITALLLGVQTTIIGSTRTVYEMSRDGQIIKQFGAVNKFKVPVGSMYLDMAITIGLLVIFKDNIVNLIAASNVGYMIVWMLLPIAYLMLRFQQPNAARPFKLPNWFIPIAAVVCLFNWLLMFIGGYQWGGQVMGTGIIIELLFIPFYLYRRMVQDKRPVLAMVSGHIPEMAEGDDDLGGRREVIHGD
jgi:amino acid transporter